MIVSMSQRAWHTQKHPQIIKIISFLRGRGRSSGGIYIYIHRYMYIYTRQKFNHINIFTYKDFLTYNSHIKFTYKGFHYVAGTEHTY